MPSRFDLGKSKYGGPFTVEEVEDVKVFYEILKVMLSFGPWLYLINITLYGNGIHPSSDNSTTKFDSRRVLAQCNGLLVAVVTIPLWICISRHFKSCSLHIFRSLRKFEIGAVLMLLNVVFMLGVNIASHVRKDDLKCMFQLDGDNSPAFTAVETAIILVVQQGLAGFSTMLISIYICLRVHLCPEPTALHERHAYWRGFMPFRASFCSWEWFFKFRLCIGSFPIPVVVSYECTDRISFFYPASVGCQEIQVQRKGRTISRASVC